MNPEDREAYEVQAQFEETSRDEVRTTPLPTKGKPLSTNEESTGSSALKKMSSQRLLRNYATADSHPVWTKDTQMGDSL